MAKHAKISTESLVSSIVPRLYFKRIILESGSRYLKHMDKEDPHIDPRKIAEQTYFEGSALAGGETVTIPEHMAHGWISEGKYFKGKEQLIVTVDVVLKEVIHPDDPLGGWFQEEGFKYLKFGVLQLTDGADIATFSTGGIEDQARSDAMYKKLAQLIMNPGQLPNISKELDLNTTSLDLVKSVQVVNLSSLQSSQNPGPRAPTGNKIKSHVQSDGSIAYDIPHRFTFVVDSTDKPDNLTYFAAVGFDESLFEDSELAEISIGTAITDDLNSDEIGYLAGSANGGALLGGDDDLADFTEITSETIIRAGSTMSFGTVFRIAPETAVGTPGEIWAGPVHYNEDHGWMAGMAHINTPHASLIAEKVVNTAIQDFRKRKKIENLNINLAVLSRSANPKNLASKKVLTRDKSTLEDMAKEYPYFSNAWMAKGNPDFSQYAVQFLFAVDFLSLVKDNVRFPGLIERYEKSGELHPNSEITKNLTKKCRIESMEIFRRRVKTSTTEYINQDTSSVITEKRSEFSKNDIVEVIAQSVDNKGFVPDSGIFSGLSGKGLVSGQGYSPVQILKEIKDIPNSEGTRMHGLADLNNNLQGVRYFSVVDPEFNTINDGIWQYGVRMTIKDPTTDYIIDHLLSPLSVGIKFFELYYSKCIEKGAFNILTGGFTKKFKKDLEKGSDELISLIINKFNDHLKLLHGEEYDQTFVGDMIAFTGPECGSPKGVKAVLELMKNFYAKVAKIVDPKPSRNIFPLEVSSPTPSSAGIKESFTLEHFFDETVDAKEDQGVGWDYIPSTAGMSTGHKYGLPHISAKGASTGDFKNYLGRMFNENSKYYSFLPDIDFSDGAMQLGNGLDTSRYSYLTPMTVNLPGLNISDSKFGPQSLGNFLNLKLDQQILAYILKYNIGRARVGGTYISDSYDMFSEIIAGSAHDTRRYQIAQLLENKNCTFEWEPWSTAQNTNSGFPWIGDLTLLISDSLTGIEPLLLPYLIDIGGLTEKSSPLRLSNYDFTNKASAILNTVYKLSAQASKFPNQLKSLVLNSVIPSSVNYNWYTKEELGDGKVYTTGLKWQNLATFILNYMTIAQVDVFIGFPTDLNPNSISYRRPMMKKPLWAMLEQTIWNMLSNDGRPAMCRLSPYNARFTAKKLKKLTTHAKITLDTVFDYKQPEYLQLPIYNKHFIMQFWADHVQQPFEAGSPTLPTDAYVNKQEWTENTEYICTNLDWMAVGYGGGAVTGQPGIVGPPGGGGTTGGGTTGGGTTGGGGLPGGGGYGM